MMPMVAAARPELDGIKKDKITKKIKARIAKAAFGMPLKPTSPQCRIVPVIIPSFMIT